jgi:hypothetical protein
MTNLRVSDHAVLRYLERVGGFDIERLRSEIAARVAVLRKADSLYVRLDGVSFVIRDEGAGPIVTTALGKTKARRPRQKRRGTK